MNNIAVWHGSQKDFEILERAANENCACVALKTTCPAHQLLTNQGALEHFAYLAVLRNRLLFEEEHAGPLDGS